MRKNVIALVMVVFAVVVVNVMLALDASRLYNFAKVSLATVEAYGNYENFPEDPFPDSGGKAERKVTSNYYEYSYMYAYEIGSTKYYYQYRIPTTEIDCPGRGEVTCARTIIYGTPIYDGITEM